MKHVDSSNISEFLYEIGGNRYNNVNWFKRKWWDVKIAFRNRPFKKLDKLKRKFLLEDIQYVRCWDVKFRRLRYLDDAGALRSAMFKVKWLAGVCYITQYPGGVPLIASKPKGPMKFRTVECSGIEYRWLGLRRVFTWEINYQSAL